MSKATPALQPITIKLLHERRSSNRNRKVDGRSGMVYTFRWNDDASAYCYTSSSADEVADIFENQGRTLGSYFSPVFSAAATPVLPEHVSLALLKCDISLPESLDATSVACALVAAFECGKEAQRAESAAPAVDPVVPKAKPAPKAKTPPATAA